MLGWVSLLKREIHDLQAFVLTLAQEYTPAEPREKHSLEALINDVADFCLWVDILPEDEASWQWIGGRVIESFETSEKWMDRVAILDLKVFLLFNNRPHQSQSSQITDLHTQLKASLARINRLMNEQVLLAPSPSRETPDQILTPYMILTTLWPFLYPAVVDQPFEAFDVQGWPSVRYHPYRTQHLIYRCVFSLSGKQSALVHMFPIRAPQCVHIQPHRTTQFFELRLSTPRVMSPERWAQLLNLVSNEYAPDLEALRELGGSLDPLTWDEGHGQGVIIRLPWANQDL